MKSIFLTFFALSLCSCASLNGTAPQPWHPTKAGCSTHSIYETLVLWEDAPLSTASYRIAIQPDTGQGPTTLVVIDSGNLINLGNEDNPATFLAAVGNSKRTCVVKSPLAACSSAANVQSTLRKQLIPLGFDMDSPAEIRVFHAPTYYLEFNDGQGNHNQWRFYGKGHPLQTVINDSMDELKSCWLPANDAFMGSN